MLKLIVAFDKKYGISKNGIIPWKIKEDMNFFKKITIGSGNNSVIMGSNTWKSLKSPLSNRHNIVVSSTIKESNNFYVVKDLSSAISKAQTLESENIFIIGGSKIYEEAIINNLINKYYIVRINKDYECDNFFPISEYLKLGYGFNIMREIIDGDNKIEFTEYDVNYVNNGELGYLNLIKNILSQDLTGRQTRNSITYSIFGPQIEFDLRDGYPLITTRQMFWRGIVEELLMFLRGTTNTKYLSEKGIKIWDGNTSREYLDKLQLNYDEGDMGPMYGFNWRHFGAEYNGMDKNYDGNGFDQLKNVINLLLTDPYSRRIMMTTYNPAIISKSVLAPCHGIVTQFFVSDNFIDCKMYQRSNDVVLGCTFNIASYALLLSIIGKMTGYKPRKLIMTFGDTHIYKDHVKNIDVQLNRQPYKFPILEILKEPKSNNLDDLINYIESLEYKDFKIKYYRYYSKIKFDMVV